MINEKLLTEVCMRVAGDYVPFPSSRFRGTYLVSHTKENQGSILKKCRATARRSREPVILSNNVTAITGYLGASAWTSELLRMGFGALRIVTFDVHGPANTLTEMLNLVAFLKARALNLLRLTAWDIQQPRAFITLVSVLLKEYPELRVYNVPGFPLDPDEEAHGSQNEPLGRRAEAYAKEIARIHAYHANGDLVDMETVLDYMDRRDRT